MLEGIQRLLPGIGKLSYATELTVKAGLAPLMIQETNYCVRNTDLPPSYVGRRVNGFHILTKNYEFP